MWGNDQGTLWNAQGDSISYTNCDEHQAAKDDGYDFTEKPIPGVTEGVSIGGSASSTTTTTTTTIPDPSSTVSQSLGSCSGPSGTRTSTLTITNNESFTAYYLVEYSTNSGSSFTTAQTNQSISGGATNTTNTVVVSDGGTIIWTTSTDTR